MKGWSACSLLIGCLAPLDNVKSENLLLPDWSLPYRQGTPNMHAGAVLPLVLGLAANLVRAYKVEIRKFRDLDVYDGLEQPAGLPFNWLVPAYPDRGWVPNANNRPEDVHHYYKLQLKQGDTTLKRE